MDYGKERLYGAVSWGVTNVIFGPLIDRFGFAVTYPCAIVAAIYSITTIVIYCTGQAEAASVISSASATTNSNGGSLPSNGDKTTTPALTEDAPTQRDRPSSLTLLKYVMGTLYGACFVLCYFLLNGGFSVVENMVFLFFEFLGGSNTICGLTVALTVIFEIPMFQLAPKLLRTQGVGWLLLLANAAYLVRIIGYTLIPQGQTWLVFLLEPFNGFTYAGAQWSAVEFVNQNMPEGYQASGQGIVNLIRGMGSVIGLYLGGVMQDAYGPRVMYRIFATIVSIGVALFGTIHVRYKQQERRQYEQIVDVGLTV